MSKHRYAILMAGAAALTSTGAWSHPTPMDDLLRPEIRVTSRAPLTLVVTLRPRVNLASATVETPNNASGVIVQCEYGSLVADQTYQCNVTGSASSVEAVLAVNVNGILMADDGHRHFSSRALAVPNPEFDAAEFIARQIDASKRAAAKAVRVKPQ